MCFMKEHDLIERLTLVIGRGPLHYMFRSKSAVKSEDMMWIYR